MQGNGIVDKKEKLLLETWCRKNLEELQTLKSRSCFFNGCSKSDYHIKKKQLVNFSNYAKIVNQHNFFLNNKNKFK
jgi:hypothetical protein